MGCQRYRYFQKKVTGEVTVGNQIARMVGNGIHHGLSRVLISSGEERQLGEVRAMIDGRDKHTGKIVEIKTHGFVDMNTPNLFHKEQLKMYLAIWDEYDGYLIYVRKDGYVREDKIIRVFRVKATRKQRALLRKKILKRYKAMKYAIEHDDPSSLERTYTRFCENCFFREACAEADKLEENKKENKRNV